MQTKAFVVAASLAGCAFGQGHASGSSGALTTAPVASVRPHQSWSQSWEGHHSWEAPRHQHHNGTVTKTMVVSRYTTYCPEPTTVCIGTKTYTVTAPTTLTITECPCTITETQKQPPPPPPATQIVPPPAQPTNEVAPPVAPQPTQEVAPPVAPQPTQEVAPPAAPQPTQEVPPAAPQPPAATEGVVTAGAEGLTAAYGFAMAAAGVVGALAF
ncbi:Mmc protein [Metarhizium rileyi]|uniref:Mmc protein n=1 Tax=Metarhizium rileyi (strain RCEF 4871) TaxID=1649241 RepID=A0A167HVK4_METRR|nr:Mmc protein [Metarhizium rileyi RCEF 4871]